VTDVSSSAAIPTPQPRPAIDPLRERLLRAAAAVFARQGYEGTRIMDVVRESGLSTGAVYGRFRSKNDLLREAVVARAASTDHLVVDEVERVADLLTRSVDDPRAPLTDGDAVRLEACVAARREPEVAEALTEANRVFKQTVAHLVEAARRDGSLAPDVDDEAALFLVRILNLGMLLHRATGVPSPDVAAWRDLLGRIVASIGTDPGARSGAPADVARLAGPGPRGPLEDAGAAGPATPEPPDPEVHP
jgi:AcrR family transcriptional regulator